MSTLEIILIACTCMIAICFVLVIVGLIIDGITKHNDLPY